MKLYSQKDVDKKALKGARICVLGYGSQGRAHALNLKDSGFDVVIGVRKGDSWKKAKKDGLPVAEPIKAVQDADLVAMLAPDLAQKGLYEAVVGNLKTGATVLFDERWRRRPVGLAAKRAAIQSRHSRMPSSGPP